MSKNNLIREKVNSLIFDCSATSYYIEKETGVSRSTTTRILNGQRSIDNLRLETCEKLANLYDRLIRL
ncbi:hypothetical protein [Staphylococcus equorum]|uniref:hypothetical protein n=1 Tax=Staphylococcus equorum TaxID=246432 RepID=UPI001ED92240|nr:hypothetical protein [Staphylococcus equorum]